MYTTSTDFKTVINNPSREFECKVICGSKTYTNVNIVNINITGSLQPSGYTIGSAISQKATFKFINNGVVTFPSNIISLEIGLYVNNAYEYVPIGNYTIDSHDSDDYTITITAYDNMTKFESKYNGSAITLRALAQEVCSACGVTLADSGSIPTTTITTPTSGKYTCRELMGYIAGCCCGNAVIDRVGQLKIQKLNLSNIDKQVTTENWFTYKNADMVFSIEKLICDTGNGKIESGSSTDEAKQLTIKNALMTQSMLDSVKTELSNITFTGFNVKYQGDISTDLGDTVKITDRNSNTLTAPLLQRTINYNGGLTENIKTEGKKKVDLANSYYANGRYGLDFDQFKFDMNKLSIDTLNSIEVINSKLSNIENELDLADCNEYIIDLDLLGSNTYTRSRHRYAIDWGDGTVNNEASHTYSNEDGVPRQYTIKTKDLLSDNNIKKSLVEIKQINFIPLYFPIDWVDDGTQTNATEIYKEYPELVRVGDISGKIKNLTRAFYWCPKLQYCANLHEGTKNTTEMYKRCRKLKDTCKLPSTVVNASKMYMETGVETVDGLNEGLIRADYMFCNSKVSIVDKPFPKSLTNIEGMFNYCSKLEEFDFGLLYKCTIDNGKALFDSCKNLATIKGSIGKIKQCNQMFSSCKISKIPDFTDDTTVEIADYMFSGIEELNDYGNGLPNTITSMKSCFCYSGVTAPLSTIPSGVTNTDNLAECYMNCENLTDISNFTSYLAAHTRTSDNYCFNGCRNIENKVSLAERYPFWGINRGLVYY